MQFYKTFLMCFKMPLVIVAFFLVGCSSAKYSAPLSHQQQVDRQVEALHKAPGRQLRREFREAQLTFPPQHLQLVALKQEQVLEVWTYESAIQQWVYVKSYPFTAFSGVLGPKLKEGDRQIPEGIYKISFLNPNSKFHLSLKVDYPNVFDVLQAQRVGRTNLGGDIFIHGKSSTIGCIPIGDANIEELFYLVGMTPNQSAGIIIAPYDLRHQGVYNNTSLQWVDGLYQELKVAMQRFHKT